MTTTVGPRVLRLKEGEDQEEFLSVPAPDELHAETVARDRPDARWMARDADGAPRARCSTWWRRTPRLRAERVGFIGHFAAADAEAGAAVLEAACDDLAAHGVALAVGPVDGSTWGRYRFIVERGDVPRFFLEPDNLDEWPELFVRSGFGPLATYRSTEHRGIDRTMEEHRAHYEHLDRSTSERGIVVRGARLDDLEGELGRIHQVVEASFGSALLYSPIDRASFVERLRPLAGAVVPELLLIAEAGDRPVGLLFAIPDHLQAARGERVDRVIIKTFAVIPEWAGQGLGLFLVGRCYEEAVSLGYTTAVHALMHDDNRSRELSDDYAMAFRRYQLFARRTDGRR